jgi:hypothetical protein
MLGYRQPSSNIGIERIRIKRASLKGEKPRRQNSVASSSTALTVNTD